MDNDPIEVLRRASQKACYHDNAKSSRDAEYILWVTRRIIEHSRSGDERYAVRLTEVRNKFVRTLANRENV